MMKDWCNTLVLRQDELETNKKYARIYSILNKNSPYIDKCSGTNCTYFTAAHKTIQGTNNRKNEVKFPL